MNTKKYLNDGEIYYNVFLLFQKITFFIFKFTLNILRVINFKFVVKKMYTKVKCRA